MIIAKLHHESDPRWLALPGHEPPGFLDNQAIYGGEYGRMMVMNAFSNVREVTYVHNIDKERWELVEEDAVPS
jgi:hypothetical protein